MYTKYFLNEFLKSGIITLNEVLNNDKCDNLLENVKKNRKWSKNLFRSENEFKIDPQINKTNPGRGVQNLAEKYNLDFIENNDHFKRTVTSLLGKDYEIILKKFVVAVPDSWLPNWLKKVTKKRLINNLGPYIKKEFRDVTYFRGIDYHMDLIDHPNQKGEYITGYVYLHDIDMKKSPLHLIENSHCFGPTKFPHFIKDDQKETIIYGINKSNYKRFNKKILNGNKGTVYFWSSMTLHGTIPAKADHSRISIRYTIKKNSKNKKVTLIDKLFNSLKNTKGLKKMRDDIDLKSDKHDQLKFNKILK